MDWEKPCSTAHTFILKSFLARATRVHLADIQRSQGTKCLPEGYKDLTKTCQGMSTKICYPIFGENYGVLKRVFCLSFAHAGGRKLEVAVDHGFSVASQNQAPGRQSVS